MAKKRFSTLYEPLLAKEKEQARLGRELANGWLNRLYQPLNCPSEAEMTAKARELLAVGKKAGGG